MTTDSPLANAFVAAPDNWTRGGSAVKAVVAHMAEGGGTVSWLTRNDGNSSHYVVEYSGRIVQMVAESRAAGSMNPNTTRTNDDPPFTFEGESVRYGATALHAAGIASDPNRYAIAIEVEGFALLGPNPAQRASLRALVNDIRRRRGPLPVLGHRDQQGYKACPGHRFPWADYGGHAVKRAYVAAPTPPPSAGDTVKSFSVPEVRTLAKIANLAWLYGDSSLSADPGNVQLSPSRELVLVGTFSAAVSIVAYEPAAGDTGATSRAMFVRAADVTATRPVSAAAPVDTSPFNQADIDAAVAKALAVAARDERERIAAAIATRIRTI